MYIPQCAKKRVKSPFLQDNAALFASRANINTFCTFFSISRALCSHLRVSEEKSLAKEDITVQVRSGTETSPGSLAHNQVLHQPPFQAKKNFTTFAALNKSKVVEQAAETTSTTTRSSSSSSLILQPAVEEQDKQIDFLENKPVEVGENVDVVESSLVDNNKFISSSSSDEQDQESIITPKFVVVDDPVTNELKEFVKQRYARRYRSKFPRHHRKSSTNLIDEVILEEDEDALAAENLEVISEEPCNPVKSILKRNSICTNSSTDSDNSDENYSNSSCYSNKSDLSESGIELSSKEDSSEAETAADDKMMMLKRHQQKRKKGVTFSPEPVKTSAQ